MTPSNDRFPKTVLLLMLGFTFVYVSCQLKLLFLFGKDQANQGNKEVPSRFALKDNTVQILGSNQESCKQNVVFDNSDASSEEYPMFYPPPLPPDLIQKNATLSSKFRVAQGPRYGEHRCNKNAVMTFAHGYQLPQLMHFMTSLWQTGYDGDLVIGVGTNLTKETRSFLEDSARTHSGLVVYEISLSCQRKNSCRIVDLIEQHDRIGALDSTSSWTPLPDARPYRRVSVVRYEYYWAWATKYDSKSLLFLSDARDVYFQRDPIQVFLDASSTKSSAEDHKGALVFFQEALKISESNANSKWLENTYNTKIKNEMADQMVICSGTTLGSQAAIEIYARAMMYEFDKTHCKRCANKHDQCFHNFLIHQNRLVGANGGAISNVVVHAQGEGGLVNTVGMVSKVNGGKSLHELKLINSKTQELLENDHTTVSAVVHMYDRDEKMKEWINLQIQKLLKDYRISGAIRQ